MEFTSVIRELTAEAKVLGDKGSIHREPLSSDQLDAVQEAVMKRRDIDQREPTRVPYSRAMI